MRGHASRAGVPPGGHECGTSLAARVTFSGILVLLLAGRFSLGTLSEGLAWLDIRTVLLPFILLAVVMWFAVEPIRPRVPLPWAGMALYLAWTVWMMLSATWAPATVDAREEMLNVGSLAVVGSLSYFVLRNAAPSMLALAWPFLIAASSAYLLNGVLAGGENLGRMSAFGGGPNVFVRVMILGALACLAVSVRQGRLIALMGTPFFALGAFMSGSRGGLLAAGIILLVAAVPMVRKLGLRRSSILVGTLSVGLLGGAMLMGAEQRNAMYVRFVELPLKRGNLSSRDMLAETSWNMFLERPVVGNGLGSVAGRLGEGLHAHNLLLGAAAESGLIGLALLLGACGGLLAPLIRVRALGADALFSLGAGLFILAASMFSGDFYDSRFAWFFLLLSASFHHFDRRQPEGQAGSRLVPVSSGLRGGPRFATRDAIKDMNRKVGTQSARNRLTGPYGKGSLCGPIDPASP